MHIIESLQPDELQRMKAYSEWGHKSLFYKTASIKADTFNRLISTGKALSGTIARARLALQKLEAGNEKTPEQMIGIISAEYGATNPTETRQIKAYILNRHTTLSNQAIALLLGYADHTSVRQAINRVDDVWDTNIAARRKIRSIEDKIKSR